MSDDIKLAILIIFTLALAVIGWLGYWTEFQNRVKLEKQIKRFYEGPENEVECGLISKRQQVYQKILLKTRKITDTGIF